MKKLFGDLQQPLMVLVCRFISLLLPDQITTPLLTLGKVVITFLPQTRLMLAIAPQIISTSALFS